MIEVIDEADDNNNSNNKWLHIHLQTIDYVLITRIFVFPSMGKKAHNTTPKGFKAICPEQIEGQSIKTKKQNAYTYL
jgi:hypothetical protein